MTNTLQWRSNRSVAVTMAEFIQFRIKPDSKRKFQAIANLEGVTVTSMLQGFIDSKIAAHSQVKTSVNP